MASVRDGEFELLFASAPMREWATMLGRRRLLMVAAGLLLLFGGPAVAMVLLLRLLPYMVEGSPWWVVAALLSLVFAFEVVVVVGLVLLLRRKTNLKRPVLEAVAKAKHLTYRAERFEPPINGDTADMLIGYWNHRRHAHEDCFHGHDADGKGFTFFDLKTIVGRGKHAQIMFDGTIHAFDREGGPAQILVWPPARWHQGPRGGGPIPPVTIGDAEFEAAFEVRATDAGEAVRLLRGTALARFLLEQRGLGRIHAYVGPTLAILGVGWKDRFEVGAMLGPAGPRARAQRMHGQIRQSMELLRRFRSLVG